MNARAPWLAAREAGASGFVAAVVHRFDRRTLVASALVLLGLAALSGYVMVPAIWVASPPTLKARLFVTMVTCLAVIVAIVAADEAVDRGVPRLVAYPIAVVAGALVGSPLGHELRALAGLGYGPAGKGPVGANAAFAFVRRADIALIVMLVGGLAAFVHASRRTAMAARRRQHEAERARAAAQRRTLESQLQALQARVEPAFLFGTLERIRALYLVDRGEGGRVLEHLIAYLRAALPHLRESTSTVAQEATLARSWLDIVVGTGSAVVARFDIDERAQAARIPALMLLPLMQLAIDRAGDAIGSPGERGRLRVELRAQALDQRLRVCVRSSGGAFVSAVADDAVLGQIGGRVRALFGADALFTAGEDADASGGSIAIVELPLETIDPATEARTP